MILLKLTFYIKSENI